MSQRHDTDFYRQLFEEVSDSIFVYDPETGRVVDANPAAATLTGYAVETLRDAPVTQFTAGTPAEVERAVTDILDRAQGGDQRFEWLVERADGEVRTTEVTLHRTRIDGADRVLAIMRDVTERNRERAELEQSRQRLSLVTETSPDVFWMFSPDWEECLYVNDAYERVWGRSTDALKRDPTDFLAGVHPADREKVERGMRRLADGSRIDLEYRVNEGEDFGRWVWVEGVPVYDETGELHRLVGYSRDITQRKRLETALDERNEQLSTLTENVPVVLFELDAEGVFVQSVGRGLRELGRDPQEVVGKSIDEVYADNEAIRDACQRALDGERVKRTVTLGDLVFDAWYEPTRDDEGRVDGVIGVAVNVTDRQQLQTELQANERALTELHTRASRTDRSLSERIQTLLDVGRERLDLPYGFLTRIGDETQHIVEARGSHEQLQAGASAPLDEAYCRRTIEGEGLLAVQNAPEEGWHDDPAYERFGLNCYLGGRLTVDGELYGTVCFASSEVRDRAFSDFERAFVELLIQWLSYELEREAYEDDLHTRASELETVLETSPLAIVELDDEAVVRQWNSAAEELFGVAAADAVGSRYPAVPDTKRATFEQLFERVMRGEQVTDFEVTRERADGPPLTLALNAAPIDGPDEAPAGVVATFTDVTRQKRRETRLEALRRATQRLVEVNTEAAVGDVAVDAVADALGHPVCAMWLYDDDDEVLSPLAETDAAVELVGPTPVIERGDGLFWTAFDTGRPQRFDDLEDEETRLNPETSIRSELVVPVGRFGVFSVAAERPNAFTEQDARVVETLASALEAALERIEDEQLLRAREAELQRRNEQLDEFASVVAHDIRGPLTAAQGFLELAREADDDALFEQVERAHARMERLIDDLLTLAREGRAITEAEHEPVDVDALARTAWPTVHGAATLEIEPGIPTLWGDESRLESVFYNLFRNSVEHGSTTHHSHARGDRVEHSSTSSRPGADDSVDHGGPEVTVRVGPLPDAAGFYVEDDGPGIPVGKRPHVFDFGYTDSITGTGLGLAIVREVVEAHGWAVSVTDGRDGGARFEIRVED